ncbi:GTP cyclohydrolase FolE2 [Bacillus sp. CGMCC 1.16541]|uniref:GTP cyclohydrolase FolE2 n=1 Tax=Bacillus sp. CGMCC 1.16541 TaxID=2185143 RepID=UPI001EF5BD76|nr:GTP cyclohydrolase FolE2 [Bacillus sp. CGMCC 1.16541]
MTTMTKIQLPFKEERHKLFGSVEPGPKTKPTKKEDMPDLQNTKRDFLFDIEAVGISNVKMPVVVESTLKPTTQTTIATFTLTSSVSRDAKGTNMSRFTELLEQYRLDGGFDLSFSTLSRFIVELADRLGVEDAKVDISYPWFYDQVAPASGLSGLNHAEARMTIDYNKETGIKKSVGLTAVVKTLCPCSKEISEYSAHNQRGNVIVDTRLTDDVTDTVDWKASLLEAIESNGSAKIHPILKRPDEKMVTEQAYENPRFVEDMVRLVAADLYEYDFVEAFTVSCRNEESIHLHDAVARVSFDKTAQ